MSYKSPVLVLIELNLSPISLAAIQGIIILILVRMSMMGAENRCAAPPVVSTRTIAGSGCDDSQFLQAIRQERRRYGFVLERQCSLAKHYLAYRSQVCLSIEHLFPFDLPSGNMSRCNDADEQLVHGAPAAVGGCVQDS